jgi:hypothetical protein
MLRLRQLNWRLKNLLLCLVVLMCSRELIADSWLEHADLDNLVPYTTPSAGWSDMHSNINLTWKDPKKSGLQQITVLTGFWGEVPSESLLEWNLSEGGNRLPLEFKSRTFRPDQVTELDAGKDIELIAIAVFPARNAIAVEFKIQNKSSVNRELDLGFRYPARSIKAKWTGPRPYGRTTSIADELPGSWSESYEHWAHGLQIPWVRDFVSGMAQGSPLEIVSVSDLRDQHLKIPANGAVTARVLMGFGYTRGRAHIALDEANAVPADQWVANAEKRMKKTLEALPSLPAKYAGKPEFERLYAHAATSLKSLSIRGDGGYTRDLRILWTSKHGLAFSFFWDSAFSTLGCREFDPRLSEEAIQAYAENGSPRGAMPGTLSDTHRAGEGQVPIMTWAAWNTYLRGHNKKWLATVYPALAGHINFYMSYHVSSRGLAKFFNAGQIADNSARFDAVYGDVERGNDELDDMESPDLNAFIVSEMRHLSLIAHELGRDDESRAWQKRADELAAKIVEYMYFPDEAIFYDVKEGTHEKFSGVKVPNLFIPLWAGVPLPKKEVDRIIQTHMLNPKEFYGDFPFPSLSFDDPKFDPIGYWRGRVWPHFTYWMIQTLYSYGYEKEADATADRLLAMFMATPYIFENYPSRPDYAQLIAKGDYYGATPDYVWSLATATQLLLQRYKEQRPLNSKKEIQ